MKKNLYFRITASRRKVRFKHVILGLFALGSGWFRIMFEVFLRKNFGERYFRFTLALACFLFLALLPTAMRSMPNIYDWLMGPTDYSKFTFEDKPNLPEISVPFWPEYVAWYLFAAAYLVFSIRHWLHKQRDPSSFDFARDSNYPGDIHPFFFKNIGGKKPNIRLVETLLEPLPFFAVGLVLWLIGQNLGILLVIGSVSYGVGYLLDYMGGDNFTMDRIDEMIANKELEEAFVPNAQPGRRLASEAQRQDLPLVTSADDDSAEAK
jgi:hypothetical protein